MELTGNDLTNIERISLLDLSSEGDHLLSPSVDLSTCPGSSELYGSLTKPKKEDSDKQCQEAGHSSVQANILRQKKKANGSFNLRKSLAWDKAFSTDEGVLDTEELALVNCTFGKTVPTLLPAIQEDLRKSFESTATFESDSLTVESIEMELFGNLRASIQKSFDKFDEGSTSEKLSKQSGSKEEEVHALRLTKITPQIKGKQPMVSKKDIAHKSRSNETSKKLSSSQHVPGGSGNRKLVVKQQTTISGIPKAPIRNTSIPQLRQPEKNTIKVSDSNHRGSLLKVSRLEEPHAITSKSSRGSSSSTNSMKGVSASCSPYTRTGRESDQARKIVMNNSRKKIDHKNPVKSSPLIGKKSSLDSQSKSSAVNPPNQSPFQKLSCISPRTSIESVNSSCSSLSTVTGTNSLLSCDSEGTASQASDQSNVSGVTLQGLTIGSASGSGSLKAPKAIGHFSSTNASSKPSGLRVPRPKIGYFDADKALTGHSNKSQMNPGKAIPSRNISASGSSSSGMLTSKLGEAVPKLIRAPALHSEIVLQSAAACSTNTSPRSSFDDTTMVNGHPKELHLHEVIHCGSDETGNSVCEVVEETHKKLEHSRSNTQCSDPCKHSVKENSEEKNFKKASVASENPSYIPSPYASKNAYNHRENGKFELVAEDIGKENLSPFRGQVN